MPEQPTHEVLIQTIDEIGHGGLSRPVGVARHAPMMTHAPPRAPQRGIRGHLSLTWPTGTLVTMSHADIACAIWDGRRPRDRTSVRARVSSWVLPDDATVETRWRTQS